MAFPKTLSAYYRLFAFALVGTLGFLVDRQRIERIRQTLSGIDTLCSGTLLQRTKVCGKSGCRCAQDVSARHGPYYEWGHMVEGKLVHRVVSPQQAALLQTAIDNYRHAQRLLREWETETEYLIDAEAPRKP